MVVSYSTIFRKAVCLCSRLCCGVRLCKSALLIGWRLCGAVLRQHNELMPPATWTQGGRSDPLLPHLHPPRCPSPPRQPCTAAVGPHRLCVHQAQAPARPHEPNSLLAPRRPAANRRGRDITRRSRTLHISATGVEDGCIAHAANPHKHRGKNIIGCLWTSDL